MTEWFKIEQLPKDRQFMLVVDGGSFHTIGVWVEDEGGYMLQCSGYPHGIEHIREEFAAWAECPEFPSW